MAPTVGRSPGDPVYDPFWARLAEAGITVAYHSGEAGYGRYAVDWGESAEFEAFRTHPFTASSPAASGRSSTRSPRSICHGVFDRLPNLRVATIESGSEWVPPLLEEAGEVVRADPGAFGGGDPVRAAPRPRLGVAVLRGRHPRAPRRARRRPRAVRLRLPARRGPRRPAVVRRRPRRLHRRRDPPHHARERHWHCPSPASKDSQPGATELSYRQPAHASSSGLLSV